jgi:2,3-bisphosphoglycerate-independent phosphoglycerate mutase
VADEARSLLLVLDGAGIAPQADGSAITAETMPFLFGCIAEHGCASLDASGEPVGLQRGHTGNSEVGHLTIGAGRRVPSVLESIGQALADGSWERSPVWSRLASASVLHLVGLVSDAGVHGYWPNIVRTAKLARRAGVQRVVAHAVLDGVDARAGSAPTLLAQLCDELAAIPGVECTAIIGRRWACDRSGKLAVSEHLVDHLKGRHELPQFTMDGLHAFLAQHGCEKDFPCHRLDEHRAIADGEPVLITNNRADRTRQMGQVFARTNPVYSLVELGDVVPRERVFFPKIPLAEGVEFELQRHGIRSLRIAEQCKFPHVTYFFNGFNESLGEDRICIDSVPEENIPDNPAMSVTEITDAILEAINRPDRRAVIVNFANLDQVGHTGRYELAVEAARAVDKQLRRIHDRCRQRGWTIVLTSDHGNADRMVDGDQRPFGSHSDRPVPLVCVPPPGKAYEMCVREGSLANVASTYLTTLGLEPPEWMEPSLVAVVGQPA